METDDSTEARASLSQRAQDVLTAPKTLGFHGQPGKRHAGPVPEVEQVQGALRMLGFAAEVVCASSPTVARQVRATVALEYLAGGVWVRFSAEEVVADTPPSLDDALRRCLARAWAAFAAVHQIPTYTAGVASPRPGAL